MKLQLNRMVAAAAAFSMAPFLVQARSPYGLDKTLVLFDEGTHQELYSTFFADLKERGLELDFLNVKDTADFDLIVDGENEYDNLLVLPTKVKSLGPKLKADTLLEFFNKGGNILAITNAVSSPESLREFLNELEISVAPRGYRAIDHFSYDTTDEIKHDVIRVSERADSNILSTGEVLYRGSAAYLGNSNPHVVPIAHGSKTSYAYDAADDGLALQTPWASGTQLYYVAGFQGNNNARVAWAGSSDLFSDEFFGLNPENRKAAAELSKWTFQEKNVLKLEYSQHEAVNETAEWSTTSGHALYHVKENVKYTAALSEWDGERWTPYVADDIQLEFVMLDPYYRLTFGAPVEQTATAAVYVTEFKVPDQHGIFTFKLDYERPGLTFLRDHKTVTVRHTANDEWPRSWEITNSWVYMSSFLAVVGAWIAFVVFYLFIGKGGETSTSKAKKNN
ncbi:similar to Saccharomyces cerevisiae YEL002C WBP1 Beta subunit of the oligosaccharyl transferase (OST) glycoprotein complex [Geotrichum candidum]|uniref:Dolichyl-diphosphooligosaccharide--protein glycosyltransferase subunit WBP1 n=1 Tax=Geotrichum candidum TaxID=1173061 RepID=A0A0J9XCE9_GEOCN|nr:similar to Saccharomyces cerevisiae YEL002C WBP1 Beta subunit of the oligosaccharyl transferase (OST) glycoprotein complex [Geotrichum candidum]